MCMRKPVLRKARDLPIDNEWKQRFIKFIPQSILYVTIFGMCMRKPVLRKARDLQQALTDEIFPSIYEATSAKQAWDILQVEFRGTQETRSDKLRFYVEEFDHGVRMEGLETCREYYSRLRLMVSRIRYYGGLVRKEAVVRKLLEGLPEEFKPIVSAMGAAGHLTISAPELIWSLEAFEMRLGLGREGRGARK